MSISTQPVKHEPTIDELQLNNLREIRTAVRFIAWIIGIFTLLSVIGGCYMVIVIVHAMNTVASPVAGM